MTEPSIVSAPAEPSWLPGPLLAEFPDKAVKTIDDGTDGIVVINFGGSVTAFRNSCLHQELPLHAGYLTADGMLLCPWHNWCYQVTTGECLTVPGAELERFPVQIKDERVWVRVRDEKQTDGIHSG